MTKEMYSQACNRCPLSLPLRERKRSRRTMKTSHYGFGSSFRLKEHPSSSPSQITRPSRRLRKKYSSHLYQSETVLLEKTTSEKETSRKIQVSSRPDNKMAVQKHYTDWAPTAFVCDIQVFHLRVEEGGNVNGRPFGKLHAVISDLIAAQSGVDMYGGAGLTLARVGQVDACGTCQARVQSIGCSRQIGSYVSPVAAPLAWLWLYYEAASPLLVVKLDYKSNSLKTSSDMVPTFDIMLLLWQQSRNCTEWHDYMHPPALQTICQYAHWPT